MKKYSDKSASELASLFLNGDKKVTLQMIREAEIKERFNYCLDKASFGKKALRPFVIFPVAFFCIFID